MSRRRPSLVLTTVMATALMTYGLLVPQAQVAPGAAAAQPAGTSEAQPSPQVQVSAPAPTTPPGSGGAGGRVSSVGPSPLSSAITHTPTATIVAVPTPTPTPTMTSLPQPVAAPAPAAPAAPAPPDCSALRCIALTFDDGPGPYTATLLDELAAKAAPATFFLVGRNVAKYPDLVAREVAAGHAIGNHSWDHHDLTTLPPDQVAAELDQTSAAITAAAGVSTALVRPPYGSTDDQVKAALAARGQAAIFWSVDTEDWKNRDVGQTTQRALAGAAPGAIILMHDIHPTTVQAVPGIIDALRAAGYTLVTVPQLLPGMTGGGSYRHG